MCYSFINAVTWAGVQGDKRSSGVKPPAQVWELLPVPRTHGVLLRSSESFLRSDSLPCRITLHSFSFTVKTSCHCPSVKALEGTGEAVWFFLKGLGL